MSNYKNSRQCGLNLPNRFYIYPLQTWLRLCDGNSLKIIRFDEIELHTGDLEPQSKMWRYYLCDTRFPPILYKKPEGGYKIIDGYHRITKLMNNNETTGIFFVITYDVLHNYYDNNKKIK
tara:strand:+ start:3288 stop:3647 length:360 start_codon:yes stop_codon:yes gene_type:complete